MPPFWTLRHVRVVLAGRFAVVPVIAGAAVFVNHVAGREWIGIGVNRLRIEVPQAPHDPPPTVASVMVRMVPIAAAPDTRVEIDETVDVAAIRRGNVPVGARRPRQRGSPIGARLMPEFLRGCRAVVRLA